MIGTLLGALVGEKIDADDGDGGAAGALLGAATVVIMKRLVPLAVIGAGILVAKHYLEKAGLDKAG